MSVTPEEFMQAKAIVNNAMSILETIFCDLYLKNRMKESTEVEADLMNDLEAFYSCCDKVTSSIDAVSGVPPADDLPPWEEEDADQ